MSKRKPGSDLNHENWDKEEAVEHAGDFQKASTDSLKARKIIRPKRRLATSSSIPTPTNPFSSFGFSTSTTKPAVSPFANFSFQQPSSSAIADAELANLKSTVSESKPKDVADLNSEIASSTSEGTKQLQTEPSANDNEATAEGDGNDPVSAMVMVVNVTEVSRSCPSVEPDSTESTTDDKISSDSILNSIDFDEKEEMNESLVDLSVVPDELETSSDSGSP